MTLCLDCIRVLEQFSSNRVARSQIGRRLKRDRIDTGVGDGNGEVQVALVLEVHIDQGPAQARAFRDTVHGDRVPAEFSIQLLGRPEEDMTGCGSKGTAARPSPKVAGFCTRILPEGTSAGTMHALLAEEAFPRY